MSKLKWFAGGEKRGEVTIQLLQELIEDMKDDPTKDKLTKVLENYVGEFKENFVSVPLLLCEMSLEISAVMRKNGIVLDKKQEALLMKATSMLDIRYGFM